MSNLLRQQPPLRGTAVGLFADIDPKRRRSQLDFPAPCVEVSGTGTNPF